MNQEDTRSLARVEAALEQIVTELKRVSTEFKEVHERVVILERRWNVVYGIGLGLMTLAGGMAGFAGVGKLIIGISE